MSYPVPLRLDDVSFADRVLTVSGSCQSQVPDASLSVPDMSGSLPEVSGDVSVPSVGGGVDVDVAVPSIDVDASAPSAPSIDLPGECTAPGIVFFAFGPSATPV